MNIFEDLIDDLKEQNLLEETVTKASKAETVSAEQAGEVKVENLTPSKIEPEKENLPDNKQILENQPSANLSFSETTPKTVNQPINEADYYRKRAIEEVSFLQMVEYVFAGVEREQMKVAPKPYDDLEVKKVLHSFLQVSGDVKSTEHSSLEFQLLQETENWYSALSHRDKRISVAHLRRYCESTRPPLSAPAVIALGRFYRNAPYSEQVRSKFDLVVTKLFAKDIGNEKRELAFGRDELIEHLNELYADWSSIPLYSTDEEDSDILLMAMKFEDFMAESEAAENFDELVRNDFFNRLRGFKASTNEQFFAPLITAAAIESNIRIGNRYVELLAKEREKGESSKLEDKYGFIHDQIISDATSKSLQLVELLKEKNILVARRDEAADGQSTATKAELDTIANPAKKAQTSFFAVNKWLLAATIFTVVISFGLYFWADYQSAPDKVSQNVKRVNLENSSLKEYIKEARISNDTFFGIVLPSWSGLNHEKREEILKKIVSAGNEKGFKSVHLLDKDGKTTASASNEDIIINN